MSRRLSWDEVWMEVARVVARRSACVIGQHGAVVVTPANRIVSTGINGLPRDMRVASGRLADCSHDCPRAHGCERSATYDGCLSIHAEANALLFVDRTDCEGGTMYVTGVPCISCAKLIANSGLKRVYLFDDAVPHRSIAQVGSFLSSCDLEVVVI